MLLLVRKYAGEKTGGPLARVGGTGSGEESQSGTPEAAKREPKDREERLPRLTFGIATFTKETKRNYQRKDHQMTNMGINDELLAERNSLADAYEYGHITPERYDAEFALIDAYATVAHDTGTTIAQVRDAAQKLQRTRGGREAEWQIREQ